MQIFIHRGKSKARDCGCGGNDADPLERLNYKSAGARKGDPAEAIAAIEKRFARGEMTRSEMEQERRILAEVAKRQEQLEKQQAEERRRREEQQKSGVPLERLGYKSAGMRRGDSADPASIASELKRLELNNSAFDAMIARLRSDSSIGQPEWHQIASQFIGWSPAKSTPKAKLLQLITNAQALNARQSARMPRQN